MSTSDKRVRFRDCVLTCKTTAMSNVFFTAIIQF